MAILESPTDTPLGLFLVQVVVVLCVVRILGTLLRRLKQPMVIGEILAGIALGPSLLGWIPGFTETFFPDHSLGYISLIAQVALIFFMFFLGMDVDVKLMVNKWRSALPIAGTSIFVPFVVGATLSIYLWTLEEHKKDAQFSSYYLFMGTSFSFTALPVLARILAGHGLVTHPLGVQALAAAAMDDVLAWTTLALVLSYVNGGSAVDGLATAVITFVFVGFLMFCIRPLLTAIHRRLMAIDDELNSTFIFFIFVQLCIFSLFAEIAGIHAFFGAFVFGLVQPRDGKFVDDLKPKLELLIVEFFLPLYFANSGIRTQIGALSTGTLWGVAFLICVCAALSTIVPVTLVTRIFNKDWRFCLAVGILMNTRGLIALIVINIGLDIGVLGTVSFTLLILMALVTTFMTSPLVYWVYIRHLPPHEQHKRRLSMGGAQDQKGSVHADKSISSFLTNHLTQVMIQEREMAESEQVPRSLLDVIRAEEAARENRKSELEEATQSQDHEHEESDTLEALEAEQRARGAGARVDSQRLIRNDAVLSDELEAAGDADHRPQASH